MSSSILHDKYCKSYMREVRVCTIIYARVMHFLIACLGIEMANLETRLMLDNLKSELNNFKMEFRLEMRMNRAKQNDGASVADMLSALSTDIRNDLASLKARQDQLFHKQDQIQCSLAGETPPVSNSYGFRSPSACSVLAWSSTPVRTPSQCTSKHLHNTSMTGEAQQDVPPPLYICSSTCRGILRSTPVWHQRPLLSVG